MTGDSAFLMMPQELSTAVQYGAAVTWVVLNTRSLAWPKWSQELRGRRYIATEYPMQADIAAVARANGCHAERVDETGQVRGALERALAANREGRPAVVEFPVEEFDFYPGFKAFPARDWQEAPAPAGRA